MKLHIFKSQKAVLHGLDVSRIVSDMPGTLTVGEHKIELAAGAYARIPAISSTLAGSTVRPTFSAEDGEVYTAAPMTVKHGKLVPGSSLSDTELELMHRADALEDAYATLLERVATLEEKYSSDTLGFLIDNPSGV